MATFGILLAVLSSIVLVVANPVYDFSISIPEECEGKTICDVEPENYPKNFLHEMVQTLQSKEFMWTPQYLNEPPETIYYDEDNCNIRETIIKPFIVQSNTTAKLVVQTQYFQQRLKQTECLGQGDSCFQSVIRLGYTGTCTPTDGTMKLYLYNPVTQRIEHDTVTFPACCACSIRSSA